MYNCPECKQYFEVDENQDDSGLVLCPHCEHPILLVDVASFTRNSEIGGFRIIEKLGEGGMGCVYLAEQISMGRKVALKVLSDELTGDKKAVEQFMREIKLTARMEHPAIVTAIDAGEDRGAYYFAMSYVDGADLEGFLETRGRVPEEKMLKYAIRIAEALKYSWDKHRLLHRDIKPGNIIISESDDEAFLLDMGIAQHFSESFEHREVIDGSPYYMSPEQVIATPLDWRSDLYSLGATIYHACTGVTPFDAPEIEDIVEQHLSAPFPEPEARNLNMSPQLTALVRKMMEKEPGNRFESWDEFLHYARRLYKAVLNGSPPEDFSLPRSHSTQPLPGGNQARRKERNLTLFTSILGIAAVTFGIVFIAKGFAERDASRALMDAESCFIQGDDHELAVEKYALAIQKADNFMVGRAKLERASQGLAQAEKALEREIERRARFRNEIKVVENICSAINALPNEQAVKEIRSAIEKLQTLSPKLDSESAKYQQLGKKLHILMIVKEGKTPPAE